MIVAIFLLLMEEEDAFWMMTAVIEEILPPSYYSPRSVKKHLPNPIIIENLYWLYFIMY